MNYYDVIPNKVVRLNSYFFVYHSKMELEIGDVVEIEIGKKYSLGVVARKVDKPSFKTKLIDKHINGYKLPRHLIDLLIWISDYYMTHPSIVLNLMLPTGLTKKRRLIKIDDATNKIKRTNLLLNAHQKRAIADISSLKRGSVLLQGITGSGKTTIYIELAKLAKQRGKSSIILLPEIGLTSQVIAEFSSYLEPIVIIHSQLTEAERHLAWSQIEHSRHPIIIIGARSAIFSPVSNLGLIVVDEFHEPSYKQDKSPKYSTSRVASVLGKLTGSIVVFGSATPPVSDRFIAESGNHPIIRLNSKAKVNAQDASISVIDMRDKSTHSIYSYLSKSLLKSINESLDNKKQSLIYHNRRGSKIITLCQNCGWNALCPKCLIPMTLHHDIDKLVCRICSTKNSIPVCCPVCSEPEIVHKGLGTKQIETDLKRLFPNAKIARFDSDNTKNETLSSRFNEVKSGKIDILIGTQILAKGLDLPNLQTVGIINADSSLSLPDYQTNERAFQLLAQVAGRIGRNETESRLIVQTYNPAEPSIQYGINQDYEKFYNTEIKRRKNSNFPPFSHLLLLTCSYKTEATAIKNAKNIMNILLSKNFQSKVEILGPTPAFYERLGNNYRWQILVKSKSRSTLVELCKYIPKNNWTVDIDPSSLLG